MTIQTPSSSFEQELSTESREYLKSVFVESGEAAGPGLDSRDAAEDEVTLYAVAELVGDIALAEELRREAWEDRRVAEALAAEFRAKRATEAAKNMETRGFAEEAPRLKEQLLDDNRTTLFTYNNLPPHMEPTEESPDKQKTEIEGLRELDRFLRLFLAPRGKGQDKEHPFPEDAEQAQSLLDNLSFIGEKELTEASYGLGALWKQYLDKDPKHVICLLTSISNSKKYPDQEKSDIYLRNRILETFTPEELEKYEARIVDNLDYVMDKSSTNVRVILLDDWAISGRQLSRVYHEIIEDDHYRKFWNSIEINLIAASGKRIEEGLEDPLSHPSIKPPTIRAYFKSHDAPVAHKENKGHVSGLHSTTNFDFGDTIEGIVKQFRRMGIRHELPALASIVSPYKKRGKS